eukprot:TRINITY_DN60652_c0_g1_i1.p1 TRINITY_DN60652_c0_g1~~TRINITY_DN60652_c0_g1_i1.p1  ORF type:complete len:323 (+),score=67.94 TRINITY_DN60652_c0_g1_i1:46-1014(+)
MGCEEENIVHFTLASGRPLLSLKRSAAEGQTASQLELEVRKKLASENAQFATKGISLMIDTHILEKTQNVLELLQNENNVQVLLQEEIAADDMEHSVGILIERAVAEGSASVAKLFKSIKPANVLACNALVKSLLWHIWSPPASSFRVAAELAILLSTDFPSFPVAGERPWTFKRSLLIAVQDEFEAVFSSESSESSQSNPNKLRDLMMRQSSITKFIAQLFNQRIIAEKVIVVVVNEILGAGKLIDMSQGLQSRQNLIECVCELLILIRSTLESTSSGLAVMVTWCERLRSIEGSYTGPSNCRAMRSLQKLTPLHKQSEDA